MAEKVTDTTFQEARSQEAQHAEDASSEFGSGKFDRISGQTKGLVDDVKEWVDLRVKLVQLDLEERINVIANQTILTVIVISFAGMSGLFALFAAAYGLGLWFGNTALGFLTVSAVLALVTIVINYARPKFINNALLSVAKKGQSVVNEDLQLQSESDELALNPQLPEAHKEV